MDTIEKVSVVQQVEQQLRDYIQGNSVNIGDKLPTEKQLCESFNVGRGTVREAIRLLQAQGFVEIRPGRGAFVLQKREAQKEDIANWFHLNECEVRDLIDIRVALEPLAVKLAIQRCTEEDVARLVSIHRQSVEAGAAKDIAAMARCDEQFHTAIFEFSRNKPLLDICKKINSGLTMFRSKTFFIEHNIQNMVNAHAAVVDAFCKRDIELGQSSMTMHIVLIGSDLELSKNI